MSAVKIEYNNTDVFTQQNIGSPNVSRSTQSIIMGDIKGVKEVIDLEGIIHVEGDIAGCDYLGVLKDKQQAIINGFSEDYKKLTIKEDGLDILERDFCKVLNIDFPDQNYNKILYYKITLECYDELLHNEFYGISSPVYNTTIVKNEDETYSITRSISAKGENTQDGNSEGENSNSLSNSLDNAISFVNSIKIKNVIIPEGLDDSNLILIQSSEQIDRFKNNFSINETYIIDSKNRANQDAIYRYTMSRNKSFGGISRVDFSGTIKYGKNSNITNVRNIINKQEAFEKIKEAFGESNYNSHPKAMVINEDQNEREISFTFSFDNDDSYDECGVGEIIKTSIEEGENSIVTVSVEGTITKLGHSTQKWEDVESYFLNKDYDNSSYSSWIQEIAQEKINNIFIGITLASEPDTKNITENKKEGEISFNYVFTNKEKEDFKNLKKNVSIKDRAPRYEIGMNYGGTMDGYIVTRSGFQKGVVSVSLEGEYVKSSNNEELDRSNALNALGGEADSIFTEVEGLFFGGLSVITTENSERYNIHNNVTSISITREYFDDIV